MYMTRQNGSGCSARTKIRRKVIYKRTPEEVENGGKNRNLASKTFRREKA
jgi:hypothetical protein